MWGTVGGGSEWSTAGIYQSLLPKNKPIVVKRCNITPGYTCIEWVIFPVISMRKWKLEKEEGAISNCRKPKPFLSDMYDSTTHVCQCTLVCIIECWRPVLLILT